MIKLEILDGLYEQTQGNLCFGLFDKRMLLPLEQLPDAVQKETGEQVTVDELVDYAAAGLFPLLELQDGSGRTGAPLYIPSRIGMFVAFKRQGYSPDELREVAHSEEMLVDYVLVDEDMQYLDDDVEALLQYTQRRISVLTSSDGYGSSGDADELSQEREHLEFLESLRGRELPGPQRKAIEKAAFRVRGTDDVLRNFQLGNERAKVRAGYSPSVFLRGQSWNTADNIFEGNDVEWGPTIRTAMAHHEGNPEPPIRVPGFLLRGQRITTLRTMAPEEYAKQWERYRLDDYLHAWSRMRGERRCLQCLEPLAADADPRRQFCGDRCRNAAKQRRFRERNPEKVDQARMRYWASIASDDEALAAMRGVNGPKKE
jgi:hypothetical protein